ncbi:MAG: hypothetical protein Q9179_003642 [Wetmoreana sp. 5 TL-2023]
MAPPIKRMQNPTGPKHDPYQANDAALPAKLATGRRPSANRDHSQVQSAMTRLVIQGDKPVVKAPVSLESTPARPSLRFDDEQTHVSTSSTKPASLDEKSTTSGATFALDEKESLRPDDSASVKAAEEEDSCSGTGSGAPSSRIGSEAGGRAFRDQFYEISERIGHAPDHPTTAGHRGLPGAEKATVHVVVPTRQRSLQDTSTVPGPIVLPANGSGFQIDYKDPDEKLLEALESPKDRLFILRLEHEIISFIQTSRDPTLDLRTPNSFYRLLAHKLADYYALTHHVDGTMSGVKLYRTPYCRIRTPLSTFPQANPNTEVPASTQPAVRIMRRAGLVKDGQKTDSGPNTTASSIAPSKAGSETGDDSGRVTGLVSPTESNLSKDKATMTREEREAKYKETRDRIFKGFEDIESIDAAPNIESGAGVSRTSSANGKRKTRKQHNVDDGFEARSHYTAYYPTMQYPGSTFDQIPASAAYFNSCLPQQYPTYGEPNSINPTMYSANYGPGYQSMPSTPGYSVAIQQYPPANGSTMSEFSNVQPTPGYMQPMPQQYYQQPHMSPTMGQDSSAMSSPAMGSNFQQFPTQSPMPDQQWSQMTYQYPYQQLAGPQQFSSPRNQTQNSTPAPQTVSYQYGQLPCQPNLPGSRNAHPLPGSYNRQQALNPQIRSFIPGSTSQPPFMGNGFQDATAGNYFPSPAGGTPGQPHAIPPSPIGQMPTTPQFGSFNPSPEQKTQPSRKSQNSSNENQPPVKSTLAKWGTPANLPPKPPPPDPPSMDGHHSLPQNVPAYTNIQLVSNGQPMPTFQNGVYSMPGQNH